MSLEKKIGICICNHNVPGASCGGVGSSSRGTGEATNQDQSHRSSAWRYGAISKRCIR
ncbi:hypothetical protein LZ30DRAFT_719971 [Colletotrichum cereale]|nr:hypothetical protein LZ30DRAFT_719971 [Colletotrichum cereale]